MEAARRSGGSPVSHLMLALLPWLEPAPEAMPTVAVDALAVANRFWRGGEGTDEDLTAARVACWQYLDAKNRDSTTLDGKGDYLTRAVICLLYPVNDVEDDLMETAHWFREFLVKAA